MSFSAQPIVIDGKGHLLGRLASIVSKQVGLGFLLSCRTIFRGEEERFEGIVMMDFLSRADLWNEE
ncbi:hypothetical protein BCR39DRAFT_76391 [Naematelia encephala]|uniref:Uncharacterized protein n=1 Tax=Naematelia encephala TaxID=71784 RepID=A0A1Y2AE94_9TREE|nr:hypothetical protein BCR39DRAFT_76391 [Naematelia encephala]